MTAIIPFTFEAAQVRVIERDCEPWFVLTDVCTILEVGNPSQVAGRLDDDEKGICLTDTLGGPQNVAIINGPTDVPRTRGDEPDVSEVHLKARECSPHTRG